MSKYEFNQGVNFIIFLIVVALLLKGCLNYDFAGAILGPDRVEQTGE